MPYLTDLADACRKSGLKVVEVDGWKTRGHGGMAVSKPQSIVCHHTATSDKAQGDIPTLNVLIRGHGSLKGPLSQIGLSRSGVVYVIAAGRCYHAGPAFLRRQTNSYAIGIECEASGVKPIEGVQLQAYHRLVRALMEHYGIPLAHVESHGEIATPRGRKNDVRNNMTQFRNDVANTSLVVAAKSVAIKENGGIPKPLVVDGDFGPASVAALAWHIKAPAPTTRQWDRDRMFVRRMQTWVGSERTGIWVRQDTRRLQAKVSAVRDGIWGKNTTVGLQRFLNKRIAEAVENQKGVFK